MGHARLSPSAAHRWMKCPGSVVMEQGYPDDSNEYSIDGTHTHTLLSESVMFGVPLRADGYLGKTLEDHDGSFTVEQDRIDRANVALDYLIQIKEEHPDALIFSERKVDAGVWIGRDDMDGTADLTVIYDRSVEVIDYKDGFSYVEVVDNPQLMIYLLGVLALYRATGTGVEALPFDNFKITIIQPKLLDQGLQPINSQSISKVQIQNFLDTLEKAVAVTDDDDAPLVPGESQCKWCKARGECSARADNALAIIQTLFSSVELATQMADKKVAVLTDDKIREIVEGTPLIRTFLDDVSDEALRRFRNGTHIHGLKVVAGRGSNIWAEDEESIGKKLTGLGAPKDSVYPPNLVSPAQARKLEWVNRKGEKKTLTARGKKILESLIAKKDGKLTVVPESDSRAAVRFSAAELFSDVTVATVETVATEVSETLPDWLVG